MVIPKATAKEAEAQRSSYTALSTLDPLGHEFSQNRRGVSLTALLESTFNGSLAKRVPSMDAVRTPSEHFAAAGLNHVVQTAGVDPRYVMTTIFDR